MNIQQYAGNAIGGAVGGAVAGALIGLALHRKFDKSSVGKPAIAGAAVFAGLALVSTALGKQLPLVPKTQALGEHVAGHLPYGSEAQHGAWGPWLAPNYYW